MPLIVKLTADEIYHAALHGCLCRIRALLNGRRDRFQTDPVESWGIAIEGAASEIAVAKALRLFWSGMTEFGAMDVEGLQVRRSRTNCLAIRPKDADTDRFVFVTGTVPQFSIHGWIYGFEARKPEYLRDPNGHNYPAYFVPIAALHPIEDLLSATPELVTF